MFLNIQKVLVKINEEQLWRTALLVFSLHFWKLHIFLHIIFCSQHIMRMTISIVIMHVTVSVVAMYVTISSSNFIFLFIIYYHIIIFSGYIFSNETNMH